MQWTKSAPDRQNKQKLSRHAAVYVRMSTDLQKYSILNQIDVIETYAKEHDLTIVRAYVDEGRSILGGKGLDALKNMLFDIEAKTAKYGVILMLDVTRWGKFQDAPTSSDYESVCRLAGIDVRYVMQQPAASMSQDYLLGIPSAFERQDRAK